MDENKSAVEKFLEDTEQKEINPFAEVEGGQPEAVVPEVKEEKPLPFNKDPKVLKFIEKEISKRMEKQSENHDVSRETHETQTEDEFKEVVDSFTAIIGNNTPEKVNALKALHKALEGSSQKAVRMAEERIEEISNREAEADREAEEELDNAFEEIEENYDVDFSKNSKLRTEFVEFVEKIAPKDRNGEVIDYPDMNSAWETFSEIKKANTQPSRAKELANRSMARSAETTVKSDKRVDWNAVDDYMDGLK